MLSNNNSITTESATIENKPDNLQIAETLLKDAQETYAKNEKEVAFARYQGVLSLKDKYDDLTDEQKAKASSTIIQALIGIATINAETNLLDSLNVQDLAKVALALFDVSKEEEFQNIAKSESKLAYFLTNLIKDIRILSEQESKHAKERYQLLPNNQQPVRENPCAFFTKKAVRATVIGMPVGILGYSLYCAGLLTAATTVALGSLYGVLGVGTVMALKEGYNRCHTPGPK